MSRPIRGADFFPIPSWFRGWRKSFPAIGHSRCWVNPTAARWPCKFAATHPPNLKALILTAGFISNPVRNWGFLPRLLARRFFFQFSPPKVAVKYFIAGMDTPDSLLLAVERATRSVSAEVRAQRAKATLNCDATREIRQINVPLLYLQAAKDRLVEKRCLKEIERLPSGNHLGFHSRPASPAAAGAAACVAGHRSIYFRALPEPRFWPGFIFCRASLGRKDRIFRIRRRLLPNPETADSLRHHLRGEIQDSVCCGLRRQAVRVNIGNQIPIGIGVRCVRAGTPCTRTGFPRWRGRGVRRSEASPLSERATRRFHSGRLRGSGESRMDFRCSSRAASRPHEAMATEQEPGRRRP